MAPLDHVAAEPDLFAKFMELETILRRARSVAAAQLHGMEIEGGLPFDDLADLTGIIDDGIADAQRVIATIREHVMRPTAAA